VILVLCAGTSGLVAAPLCTSFVGLNAATMTALGSVGCQFGDKIFNNFTYNYAIYDSNGNLVPNGSAPAGAPDVAASDVSVQFTNLGGDPLQPVMTLSAVGGWMASQGYTTDIRLHYAISAPPSSAMYKAWVKLYGTLTNVDPDNLFAPYVSGNEVVGVAGFPSKILATSLDPPAFQSLVGVPVTGYDSVNFPAVTLIELTKDIVISSGDSPNVAVLTQIDEGLSELGAPEPTSAILLGGGLLALGLAGKRRKSTK